MSSTASSARRRCSRGNRPARPAPPSPCALYTTAAPAPGTPGRTASGPPRVLAHEPGQSPDPTSAPHAAHGEARLGPDDTNGTTPAPNRPAPKPRRERTRANRRHLSSCPNEPDRNAAGLGVGGSIPAPAIPSPSSAANGPDPAKRRQRTQACQPQEGPPAVNQPMHDLGGPVFGQCVSARTNPSPPTGTRRLERTRMPVPTGPSPNSAGWATRSAASRDGLALAPNEPKRGADAPSIGRSASAQTNLGPRSATRILAKPTQASARRSSPGSVPGTTPAAAGANGTAFTPNEPNRARRREQTCQRLEHPCTSKSEREVEAPAIGRSGSARTNLYPPAAMQFLHGRTHLSGHPSRGSTGGTTRRAAGADERMFVPNEPGPAQQHGRTRFHRRHKPASGKSNVARTNPSAMSLLQPITRSVGAPPNPGPRAAMHFLHERSRAPVRLLSSLGFTEDSRPILFAPIEPCLCRPERAL